jgi:hypothetical protein
MTRSYTLSGIYDAYSRPISQAIAKAFNATDRNSLVLVETQQLLLGECHFSALPDTVPIDINIFWAAESRWYYDIFAVTGASLEEAVSKMHQQGTDTTLGTLTADIAMGAFSLVWKAALADGEYCGITEAGIAGATLVFGNLIYQANADSRWEKVDANATVSAFGKLGICLLAAAADGSATKVLLWGKVRADSLYPTLLSGQPVYAAATAGDIVTSPPSGSGDIIRIIGYGNTADELYFCPENTFLELV